MAFAQTPVTPWQPVTIPYAPAIMLKIAACESGSQQFYPDGSLIRDSVTGTHIGIYQISESWIPKAKELGDDIYTPQGNIAFALKLYKMYGTAPWFASKFCWSGGDTS